ncbi:TRAP transporter substrate-binding protein [Thalassospira lucentensis]|uniref:Transporter n=1 Tax=Thalassospira lucentensis TaxID=168935 RepID=A0A358HR28_9PROT|nr:TRAP transporter substrate-binding protein [Thalassospira lucentensis]HBU97649.1 transporter [Thalassospira lucentensis]HCW67128.1 transporter [Thalassospira lucentensis]|tara:strand:+ start:3925 stop:4905 length:981 start_codon:yes stop_codon:yes gene_type:complete
MRKTLTAAIFAAGLSALGFVQAHAATEIRYAIWANQGEAQYEGALEFKRVVEEGADGRYTVSVYGGDQLGTPRELFTQLALGVTQISASGDPGIKEIEYLAIPYLMKGIKNYGAVLDTDFGQEWNQKLIDEREIRLLGFMPRNPRQISADIEINSIDDLKGLKLRSPERDYYVKSLSALGANPTPMAFAEVYTGLQAGVVDGQENPIETIYAGKFYEVQKSIAMVNYIKKPAYVMISDAFWQELSPEDQALLKKANDASNAVIAEKLPVQTEKMIAEMKAAGIVFTHPDTKPFIEATQSVRDELGTGMWGEEVYKKVSEIGQKDFD